MEAFLDERIPFPGIAEVVSETLEKVPNCTPRSVEEVLEIDRLSRETARNLVQERIPAAR